MTNLSLDYLGILNSPAAYHNLSPAQLIEHALLRKEGKLTETGALCVSTGKYTGRSPDDRYIVDEPLIHDDIAWGKVNVPLSCERFEQIYQKMTAYLQKRQLYVFDGFAGADKSYRLPVRVINELASQNLFIHQLLIRPTEEELLQFDPEFTIIAAPGFHCSPEADGVHSEAAIILSFERKLVLIAGSQYSGEIKKSVFSVMNYLMPKKNVFPMHCSANVGQDGNSALFFGLSGTGKTTLSADPNRYLIGDDEHGWSDHGIFNFEGGCYAKCIHLDAEHEPEIFHAIRFGALIENVVMDDDTRKPDYDDGSLTENTRAGYPVEYIPNAKLPSVANHPKAIIFLTADAFGVLPPISRLSKEAAMYHFVSGYTAKVAGTERGISEPQATFSPCFGGPFLPRPVHLYAELLGQKIKEHGAKVYLVNTGWSGGPASGNGKRMKLAYTRAMITAALDGSLESAEFVKDPVFRVDVPTSCPGVPSEVLLPRNTWEDPQAYDRAAKDLAKMFTENFKKFEGMDPRVIAAGPKAD